MPQKITASVVLLVLWLIAMGASFIGYNNALLTGGVAVVTFVAMLVAEIMSTNAFKFGDSKLLLYGITFIALVAFLGGVSIFGNSLQVMGFSLGAIFAGSVPTVVGLAGYFLISLIAGMISKK